MRRACHFGSRRRKESQPSWRCELELHDVAGSPENGAVRRGTRGRALCRGAETLPGGVALGTGSVRTRSVCRANRDRAASKSRRWSLGVLWERPRPRQSECTERCSRRETPHLRRALNTPLAAAPSRGTRTISRQPPSHKLNPVTASLTCISHRLSAAARDRSPCSTYCPSTPPLAPKLDGKCGRRKPIAPAASARIHGEETWPFAEIEQILRTPTGAFPPCFCNWRREIESFSDRVWSNYFRRCYVPSNKRYRARLHR